MESLFMDLRSRSRICRNRVQNLSLILLVFAALASFAPAFAASDGQMEQQLGQLEEKFFSQTYKSDTADRRLGRLEEMLFGHAVPGSVDQRFTAINAALNSIKKDSSPPISSQSAQSDEQSNQSIRTGSRVRSPG